MNQNSPQAAMDVTETIIDNVARGLILDTKGKWVPLSHMMAVEKSVLKHLEAGEVLCQGQWISIQKCKKLLATGQKRTSDFNAPSRDADHISQKKPVPWIVVSCNTGEQHLAQEQYLRLIRQATAAEKESNKL
jgi:hypothetical protein